MTRHNILYARSISACPIYTPDQAYEIADTAVRDALNLVAEVHATQTRLRWHRLRYWDRLNRMIERCPQQLVALNVALAAMTRRPLLSQLAWSGDLLAPRERIGATANARRKRAVADAERLAKEVRAADRCEFWGRLTLMTREEPRRLLVQTVTLAAAVPEHERTSRLLAWTAAYSPTYYCFAATANKQELAELAS
jgi:hypothetical protein